jgi:hypothetical protein
MVWERNCWKILGSFGITGMKRKQVRLLDLEIKQASNILGY